MILISKFKKYAVIGGVIMLVFGTTYWAYSKMQNKIIFLEKESTSLRQTNAVNQSTITQMRIESSNLNRINNEIRLENQRLEAEVNDVRERFSRNDIGYLASKKPALVEKIINNATKDVGNEIESITSN